MPKKVAKYQGLSFSKVSKDLNLSYRSVQILVREGELKLNDDDKIDEESYLKYKVEWDKKPNWMKKRV